MNSNFFFGALRKARLDAATAKACFLEVGVNEVLSIFTDEKMTLGGKISFEMRAATCAMDEASGFSLNHVCNNAEFASLLS